MVTGTRGWILSRAGSIVGRTDVPIFREENFSAMIVGDGIQFVEA
jgi:hypothetical protein